VGIAMTTTRWVREPTSAEDLIDRSGETAARKRRRLLVLEDNALDAELVDDCFDNRSSPFSVTGLSESTSSSPAHLSNGSR
jgi:hypothetical protein